MGKKNRVPEPEKNAFESAKAAFDRVGEDYAPASKAVELSKTEEPVETPDAAAPETSDTESAAPVAETDAAEPDTSESVATPDADGVEAADSPSDADDADADTSEAADNDATPEAVEVPDTSETVNSAETPEEPVAETDEAPDTSEAVDSDTTPETVDSAGTTADATPDADSAEPETDHDSATPEPETVEAVEDEAEESDDFWTFSVDEPEAEVTEMEKMTMETKEITLGVHRSPPKEADGAETVKEPKKPRFKAFAAFAQLKDLFRVPAANAEHTEQSDDTPQSGGSPRDAALRKRVTQIEDEETRNYLLDRVLPQMTWYSKRSKQYQTKYHQLMTIAICLGALIPVFSVWANNAAFKVILAFLGASVTAVNAYLALYKYQELWISYRNAREELIHTLYSYFNRAGVFAQKKMTDKELNVLLVEVCENTLSKENGGWSTTILQKMS